MGGMLSFPCTGTGKESTLSMTLDLNRKRREDELASPKPYLRPEDLEAFFRDCDARHGPDPEPEPDWREHLATMEKSRSRGMSVR